MKINKNNSSKNRQFNILNKYNININKIKTLEIKKDLFRLLFSNRHHNHFYLKTNSQLNRNNHTNKIY